MLKDGTIYSLIVNSDVKLIQALIPLEKWLRSYVWEEPAVSYRWTGWVWEIKLETLGEFPIILEESIECASNE